MVDAAAERTLARLSGYADLRAEINANGSLRRFDCGDISLSLFVGNELEGGPASLYLRMVGDGARCIPLLGPQSQTSFETDAQSGRFTGNGSWLDVEYSLELVLSKSATVWFWHVQLVNRSAGVQRLDLTYAQDLALAPYGAVRMNEFYVSQYVDHTPLSHPTRGVLVASRQNQLAGDRHPWSIVGSLRKGASFATDALQFHGFANREGAVTTQIAQELPNRRLQHEHSMVVVRDTAIRLEPSSSASAGFFGGFVPDHPEATSDADLERVERIIELPESKPAFSPQKARRKVEGTSLFTAAPVLGARDLGDDALRATFPDAWRHEERDERGALLSFFHGADSHVVLRSKELRVLRPHGHLLRTGRHLTPDETALTSTSWMGGVFHSMVTQGHVSINRFLSTVHSYLSLFRSHGQRVFVQVGEQWHLLDTPSAFEMSPDECRWVYRHAAGEIWVRAEASSEPQELRLSVEFTAGIPARCLISHHVALNGDDGSAPGPARWRREGSDIVVTAVPDSDVGRRFPNGSFDIGPAPGTQFEQVGGDELLFVDGRSCEQPYICVVTAPRRVVGLRIRGHLLSESVPAPIRAKPNERIVPRLSMSVSDASALEKPLSRIADIVPWFAHDALVHYLSPRGLEQYSGGGWGTRDVAQGPVELLLALGHLPPMRDLLLRVMRQQNPDGDWPQWFMFFERERDIRPGDSHGDIVFWPLVVLAQYLIASGDGGVLDERVPFFDARGPDSGELATVWQHVERALTLIRSRVIPGTRLAAYGHGDWNDSLQPADPSLRERLCSAWTVTLHVQALTALARALSSVGRRDAGVPLEAWAEEVRRDFQRLLVRDGVVAGYALFEDGGRARHLLHPSDATTGVRYSSLAMIHAILEDMLAPEQVREHLRLIDSHLSGPDGVRLFDRPLPYHGGRQRLFQRAETATFFGREIGLMYTHAHLRYAQALAHVGDAQRFFHALCQAVPIGIRSIVPSATLRQANCYYSSSDAAFEDRYQASVEYERVARGAIALDGGWRVYSSGPGIALGLIVRHFLGLASEAAAVSIDPVIPPDLDGLRVQTALLGRPTEVQYRVRGAGCGVTSIVVNGAVMPFTTRPNPHRRGAALVANSDLMRSLSVDENVLVVELG
jgi:1,2-beta-oligoglucan phosphorylase